MEQLWHEVLDRPRLDDQREFALVELGAGILFDLPVDFDRGDLLAGFAEAGGELGADLGGVCREQARDEPSVKG